MITGDPSFLPTIPSLWEIRKGRGAFVISGIFPVIVKHHGVCSRFSAWHLKLLRRVCDFFNFLIIFPSPPARDVMDFKPVEGLVPRDFYISLTVLPTLSTKGIMASWN